VRTRARRRALADRAARVAFTGGGIAIVASILGILVFLLLEIRPLLDPAHVVPGRSVESPGPAPRALLVDEHRTHVASLALGGVARIHDLESGRVESERRVETLRAARAEPRDAALAGATADGRVVIVPVRFRVEFEGRRRRVRGELEEPLGLALDPRSRPLGAFAVRTSERSAAAAAQLADGSLAWVRREVRENLLTGARDERLERRNLGSPGRLTQLVLSGDLHDLYGATETGELLWWDVASTPPREPRRVALHGSPVSALALLIGERSLVVGREDGSLAVWFGVTPRRGEAALERVHELPPLASAVRLLAPSLRDRTFLAAATGELGLYHSTSDRQLWRGTTPVEAGAAVLSPRGDAAFLAGGGRLVELRVHNRHPEVTLGTLFGRVWYEGGHEPEYVWQSSGGTDRFEPKLSLVPLLVGTLKGTFYALLLAVPLGVLGAMYTSQFMHARLQRLVKPSVEIMASLPSVVLGFLAGLWLAPRLERVLPGFLLCVLVFPALCVGAGLSWSVLPVRLRGRLPEGAEVFWFAAWIALGGAAAFALSDPLEAALFGGSFPTWLLEATGTRYDQRNAVVIGIAMGFAVIPIIFAISEDAFSNVPRSLAAASRALGANRWQTVTRVILPTASPGIFSAVMVGFGRAVGETMIVLMATGNTPILDWSPFNGFRTLSANIAVEIPEAPVGGSLYRTLFVAALLLFVLTFLVNTVAEVVRHRLRTRFARL
jgi:phosphate transport system permease protein